MSSKTPGPETSLNTKTPTSYPRRGLQSGVYLLGLGCCGLGLGWRGDGGLGEEGGGGLGVDGLGRRGGWPPRSSLRSAKFGIDDIVGLLLTLFVELIIDYEVYISVDVHSLF